MKENSEFKPVKLRLKIDLVSYPARAEVLGKRGDSRDVVIIVGGMGGGGASARLWPRLIAFHLAPIPLGKV